MGTNYYLHAGICDCCGRYTEYHIGKSSMGWKFLFQAYAFEEGIQPSIKTNRDWRALTSLPNYKIFDEYGEEWSDERFWNFVNKK